MFSLEEMEEEFYEQIKCTYWYFIKIYSKDEGPNKSDFWALLKPSIGYLTRSEKHSSDLSLLDTRKKDDPQTGDELPPDKKLSFSQTSACKYYYKQTTALGLTIKFNSLIQTPLLSSSRLSMMKRSQTELWGEGFWGSLESFCPLFLK